MAEKWYCSECGKRFDRRHDAVRQDRVSHMDREHGGAGEPVRWKELREEVRLLVSNGDEDSYRRRGRRTGLMGQRRTTSSFTYQPPTRQGRQSEGKKDNSYDILAFLDRLPAEISKTTIEQLNKKIIDDYKRQFKPSPRVVWPDYSVYRLPPEYDYSQREVFGYNTNVCDDCHIWEPLEVYFSVRPGLCEEQRGHACPNKKIEFDDGFVVKPEISPYARKLQDSGASASDRNNDYVLFPEEFLIRRWAQNNQPLQLAAFRVNNIPNQTELPKGPNAGENKDRLVISLQHPDKPKEQYITLSCNKKECLGLNRPKDLSHWINRVLKHGTSYINSREFREFLQIARTATFVFVKVHDKHSAEQKEQQVDGDGQLFTDEYYLVALTDKDWYWPAKILRQEYNKVNKIWQYSKTIPLIPSSTEPVFPRPDELKGYFR